MATDRERAEKVQKLLRLASPTSGAPEPERISAALAAAALFVELEGKKKTPRNVEPAAQEDPHAHRGPTTPPSHVEPWHRSRTSANIPCCASPSCKKPVGMNQACWRRVAAGQVEWLHENCPRPGATGI
jgi:hypothetical protein